MRLLLLFFFLLSGTIQAQNTKLDSLTTALSGAKTETERVDLNCRISKFYNLSDAQKGKSHALAAAQLATKTGYLSGKAKALNLAGYSHLILGEFDKGLKLHLRALKIFEQLADTVGLVGTYNSLGTMYLKIDDFKRANYYYEMAAGYALKINDKSGLGKVYNNLGNVFEANGEYGKALTYFKKAALIQKELGDQHAWAISLLNIGNVHLYLKRPQDGLPYLFQSLEIDARLQNKMIPVATLKSIAQIYQAIGHQAAALKYAQQSYDLALETGSSKKIAASATLLQEIYAAAKDYKNAYTYQAAFIKHQDIIDKDNQKKVAAEVTAKYETGKKELENHKLKAEQERQALEIKHKDIFLALLVTATSLLLLLLVELYRSKRRLKETFLKLQEANSLMQAQHIEINEQKNFLATQAEILKDQNVQLEKHNHFKSKVFSIISHDLRTPFNSIKGTLNLAASATFSVDELQQILALLGKEIDVSMNMLNNLLVWSKAQLTDSRLDIQPMNLHLLAEETKRLATFEADQKNIKLVNAIPANTIAFTDKERLSFVLRNLLMNAVKFSFVGGEINIQAEEKENYLTLKISDTGKGISTKNMARLFTEQRFTTTGTAKEKGTGLGLMFCKELIESLPGNISVESEENKGSVFTITLPHVKLEPVPVAIQTALV